MHCFRPDQAPRGAAGEVQFKIARRTLVALDHVWGQRRDQHEAVREREVEVGVLGWLSVQSRRRSKRLTRFAHMWDVPHGMSERGLGVILLAVLSLAASCGGGGDGAPRVTLTDKSRTYSGARTHEPGVFDIEAENTTSHFAAFAVYESRQRSRSRMCGASFSE